MASRYAAPAKALKNRKGRKDCQSGETQIPEEHRVAQRIQRVTETGGVLAHAGLPDCFLEITKDTKDTKRRRRGRVVRARKAHVRPEGPVGAWRASHATLWFWESSGDSRRPIRPIGPTAT